MSDMDKYKSLVQPIQDLVLNWDIDVAEGLTDYLEELDAIRIRTTSEEGEDGPTLNFAQAAILIQGSTAVYSKKVEYLHKLVYQALEYFSQQRDNKVFVCFDQIFGHGLYFTVSDVLELSCCW